MRLGECEQVVDGSFVASLHGEGFARASLSVGEARDDALVEWEMNGRLYGRLIECLGRLFAREAVVELEIVVFNVLGDAVHPQFAFVHSYPWVGGTHRVDLARSLFLLEDGALPHTHRNLHVRARLMTLRVFARQLVLLHHVVKLGVHVSPRGLVHYLPLFLVRLLLLHCLAPLHPLLLHTLYILYYCRLLR